MNNVLKIGWAALLIMTHLSAFVLGKSFFASGALWDIAEMDCQKDCIEKYRGKKVYGSLGTVDQCFCTVKE